MNKRGQILLIAALIAVGAIFSVGAVMNQARANEENKAFYDLSNELGFEGKRILDYGTYKPANTDLLIQNFVSEYSNYIKQEKVLFVYGNAGDPLQGHFFLKDTIGSEQIGIGQPKQITIQYTTDKTAAVTYSNDKKHVDVAIDGIIYPFELEQGQNFFFIILKDDKGDQLVATG